MTDRIHSLTVVLEENLRDDDVADLVNAIYQLRHVLTIALNVADATSFMAEERARRELISKLWKVLEPPR